MGQGGAGVSQLQNCGIVTCVCGQGWSRGWAGWSSLGTVNVNVYCDLFLLQTLISRPGWSLPLVLMELLQNCSMVMEELRERETFVEEAQVAVTEVTRIVEIFGNGVCKIYLRKLKNTNCRNSMPLQATATATPHSSSY